MNAKGGSSARAYYLALRAGETTKPVEQQCRAVPTTEEITPLFGGNAVVGARIGEGAGAA